MKIHTLNYTCEVSASAEALFAFHTDTQNLERITPRSIRVQIVSMEPPSPVRGHVVLDISRFGIATRWEIDIEALYPTRIVDILRKGPFSFFRHERHFVSLGADRAQMEEKIEFALPFGWLSAPFAWFVRRDMDAMFAHRHRVTQEYFLERKAQESL